MRVTHGYRRNSIGARQFGCRPCAVCVVALAAERTGLTDPFLCTNKQTSKQTNKAEGFDLAFQLSILSRSGIPLTCLRRAFPFHRVASLLRTLYFPRSAATLE